MCVDVDECQTGGGHNCSQLCENIPGSFECKCNDGYSLDSDGANCTGMCVSMLVCMSVCIRTCTLA